MSQSIAGTKLPQLAHSLTHYALVLRILGPHTVCGLYDVLLALDMVGRDMATRNVLRCRRSESLGCGLSMIPDAYGLAGVRFGAV